MIGSTISPQSMQRHTGNGRSSNTRRTRINRSRWPRSPATPAVFGWIDWSPLHSQIGMDPGPANPDPGPLLPGMQSFRMHFDPDALWQGTAMEGAHEGGDANPFPS